MSTVDRIAAIVAATPGLRYAELCAAAGVTSQSGFVAYVRNTGRIFAAGPRGWQRYYPTEADAAAAAPAVAQEARQAAAERKRRHHDEQNRRRKAASRVLGRSVNTRPDQAVQGEPSATRFVVRGVRVVLPEAQRTPAVPRVVDSSQARPWAQAVAP